MARSSGLVRADGLVVSTAVGTDEICIQRLITSSGQFEPRLITVTNLLAGGTDTPTLNLGSSGVAGTLNIYPSTVSSGHLSITDSSTSGNFTTVMTLATQAGAHTYTIADVGANASFVMTAGAQTVAGIKTFTSDITASGANIIAATAGKGLQVKEGSNARMGTATLVSGTITIANTSVTASTRIFVSRYSANSSTALGLLSVGTVSAGTSFIINALKEADATVQTNDVSIVDWMLVEPAA